MRSASPDCSPAYYLICLVYPFTAAVVVFVRWCWRNSVRTRPLVDRKSTRLNSSHLGISYAVFCLKKKSKITNAVGGGPDRPGQLAFCFGSGQHGGERRGLDRKTANAG